MFELSLLCPEDRVETISDALDALDAQAFVSQYFSSREKQSFSASINQPLSDTWGSFYLSGSLKK
ncbi:MAG: hypothetical protein RR687_08390, partial [Comamonas sp.]